MTVESKSKRIAELSQVKLEKYYQWVRSIMLVETTITGLMVSLRTHKSETCVQHSFYIITLCTLGLCILAGVVVQYGEVRILELLRKSYAESLERLLNDKTQD